MRKSLFFLLVALLCSSGCVQTGPASNKSAENGKQILRVGISTNSPPMAFLDKGEVTGLEADLAAELAAYTNRRLQFVRLAWHDQIPSLLNGKTDIIMSGMTVTSARDYQVSFCKPYIVTGQVSLVRLNEQNRFRRGLTDLLNQNVRVGTVTGTTGDLLILKNKARGTRTQFKKSKQAVQALIDKEIDAFVYDLPGNFHFGALYADKGLVPIVVPMTSEKIAWAVHPGNDELLNLANTYLESAKNSGNLQKMVIQRIPFYKNIYNKN